MNTGCPFCVQIGSDDADRVATFPDASPSAEGHRMVVPIRHVERVEELDPEEWRALLVSSGSMSSQTATTSSRLSSPVKSPALRV